MNCTSKIIRSEDRDWIVNGLQWGNKRLIKHVTWQTGKNRVKDGNVSNCFLLLPSWIPKNFAWWLSEQIYKYQLPQVFHSLPGDSVLSSSHLPVSRHKIYDLASQGASPPASREVAPCNLHNCLSPEHKISFRSCPVIANAGSIPPFPEQQECRRCA